MKQIRHFLLTVLAVAAISGASAATGTLKGKVVDKSTNEPLIGATVMVKGTTKGVVTDVDGSFELELDRKPHTLSISYVSYTTQEMQAEIKSKSNPEVMVLLEADSQMIDAVRVTARVNRESEFAAIADQRNAVVAMQVVGVQELSRKGVGDAQGAVMKVSGISKQEGVKNVFVRGLGDRYNATTLNGLPIPSEDPEYKNISLDFFATDIIQSVNVNKAFYATSNSDVGGANIDIASKRLSGDGELSVSVSAGVNTQTLGADVLKSDGVGAFGFANSQQPTKVNGNYTFENKLQPESASANFDRSVGISGGKRFEVAGNPLTFYAVASYDSGTFHTQEAVRDITTSGGLTKDQTATISDIETNYLGLANLNYAIGDKHTIDYNFMYIHSSSSSVGYYDGVDTDKFNNIEGNSGLVIRQQANDNTMVVNQLLTKWTLASRLKLDVAGSYNSITGLEPDRRINTFQKEDGLYTSFGDATGSNQRFYSELSNNDANIQASVTYALSNDTDNNSAVKLGYSGRFVTDAFDATQYNYIASLDVDNLNSGDVSYSTDITTNYDITKNIQSIYGDVTYDLSDKFTANLGLKYDMVYMDVVAYADYQNYYGRIDEGFFLPSLNLRYGVTDEHSLRLSASKTYTLPQAKELSPYQYVGANFTSQGNVNLLPSDNYNFDVKWDWYISSGELFSVTGFYKHIANPISRIDTGSAGGYLSYENISDKAIAAGVEIELRKNLFERELGLNKSNRLTFGLNGSYIYTDAKVDDPYLNATDKSGSQLEGAAPWIVNTDLSFQMTRGKRMFTNTLVFNYVSDKVYTIGTNGYNDIVEKGVSKLDFVSSAKLSDKFSIKLKASNLLNTAFILEQEAEGQTIELSNFRKGIDISVGVSMNF